MSRRRKGPCPYTGMLLLDKPAAMTSHDVVAWLRRQLGMRRIGHTGTLDPLATGLLPCLLGPATRLAHFVHLWPKAYVGRIVLGTESATGDREGVDPQSPSPPVPTPPRAVLDAAKARLMSATQQNPPAFSAKKIGGVPAHKLARQGVEPRLAPVPVTIHAMRLTPESGGRIRFAARVSSGTYIRSIAVDLGRILGTGAYLDVLRRTAIGPLRVREAVVAGTAIARDHLEAAVLAPARIPLPLECFAVPSEEEIALRHGRPIPSRQDLPVGRQLRLLSTRGAMIGIGEAGDGGLVHPRIVLPPPAERSNGGTHTEPSSF